jgi:hypothetical protein|tara:strand:+ start:38 stop:649 length:612 start_codon:yes stop_codon:yes gene_type:complete
MENLLQSPIPGQSLTDIPKNSPWENPSELNEVRDVVEYYVSRIADQDVMDDLSIVFELGGDLKTVTEALWLAGAMKGTHTVETGMLAGPVIATFIKAAMSTYGIDTPETGVSPSDKRKSKERKRLQTLIEAALEKSLESGEDDSGVEMLRSIQQGSEVTPETVTEGSAPAEKEPMMTESVVEETPMEEPAAEGSGLMSRGGAV